MNKKDIEIVDSPEYADMELTYVQFHGTEFRKPKEWHPELSYNSKLHQSARITTKMANVKMDMSPIFGLRITAQYPLSKEKLATYARKTFIMAEGKEGLELKKEILLALGGTPIIKDKKLIIEANEWFIPIKNEYPALETEYLGLEPTESLMDKTKTEALDSVRAHWLPP